MISTDQHSRFVRTTARQRYSNGLRLYEQQTVPILSHYVDQASLLEVDGEQPKENITQEIVMAIQSMLRIPTADAKNVQSMLEDNL